MQQERVVAGDDLAAARAGALLEQLEAAGEGRREALLLGGEDGVHVLAVLLELGIDGAHLPDHDVGEACQERCLQADAVALQDGAADDPAQHVAASLVRGSDAVGDEERHRAAVVGQHAVGLGRDLVGAVGGASFPLDPLHDRLEAVGLVHRVDALEDRRGALDAHARVDVLPGQRRQRVVGVQLELHEHEVPELEVAIALAARGAVVAAAALRRAAVVVELAAGAARPDGPRLPEVVGARQPDDPLGRHAHLLPALDCHLVGAETELGVAGEHGRPEQLLVELQVLGDELPGVPDGAVLEVVAEREVAEHLEEGEVPRGGADLVDVGRAEALLHGRQRRVGRLRLAEEERLERLHAGRGEQHRRVVVGWHERPRGMAEMPLRLEEGAEPLTDLVRRAHRPGIVPAVSRRLRGWRSSSARPWAAAPSQLLDEVALAAARSLLRLGDGCAPVLVDPVGRHAEAEPGDDADGLLHGRRHAIADGAHGPVDALHRIDGGVAHRVDLEQLVVDPIDGAADLGDHRQHLTLRTLDEVRQPVEQLAELEEGVEEPNAESDQEHREGEVAGVVPGEGQEHGSSLVAAAAHRAEVMTPAPTTTSAS